ncbi:MAG: nicotinate phosphoribosyltransferase [Candidatus Thiodiazotropha sp. (ex. Lucinisca nassula)]|nr:nicotinate phosphoribosyltransferase [Candidatus Thiodiazotropha sp. (ex. Lucinisca nassula)]
MNSNNLILNTDSYKASHYLQYPPGTEYISSYIESRGGRYPQTLFFGLQAFLKQYLLTPISRDDIDEAEVLLTLHGLPFNRQGWNYILEQYGGFLPLSIEAVPEGSVVPASNVMLQVVNTDPRVPWLTSYIETALLRGIWYPATVATYSFQVRTLIEAYLEETAVNTDGLPFKLHDFGARGASSHETAGLGGLAHLVNFQGTDTVAALIAARRWYGEEMAGFSIPAAEHSTITAWGEENEEVAYRNMLEQFAGEGRLVAVVSDSYDLWHALSNLWGGSLRSEVMRNGGTVVIRPDSGDPVKVVTETIECLMRKFGAQQNAKGYWVLPDYIRVIQGDGIDPDSIAAILTAMKAKQQSAENVAFGMGAALLQKVNRDSQRFAMKASAIRIDGKWRDVYKDPVTDPAKRSKAGRLALVEEKGCLNTVRLESAADRNLLVEVFRNGELLQEWDFEQIRQRATIAANKQRRGQSC